MALSGGNRQAVQGEGNPAEPEEDADCQAVTRLPLYEGRLLPDHDGKGYREALQGEHRAAPAKAEEVPALP